MAKIYAKVLGGPVQEKEANTVGELKRALNYPSHQATVNKSNAEDSQVLTDGDFVALTPAVKGGQN